MTLKTRATIDDLFRFKGKAELVDGEIVHMPATGGWPGYAADEIFASLRQYSRQTKHGHAVGGNRVFRVRLLHRGSFSPDAAYFVGPSPKMRFFDGAPLFAAEVRSEWDYGPAAERDMTAKRADYFAAGTLVVWDVDLLSRDVVRVYRSTAPDTPTIYRPGDLAEAEPAVPGWQIPVGELFEE